MSSEGVTDNRTLVTDAIVKETLKADKGNAAHLISFKVEDFTVKGDNYACIVTGVSVTYTEGDVELEESYVAKIARDLGPSAIELISDMMHDIFLKEAVGYFEVVPKINKIVNELEMKDLCFAKAYTKRLEKGKEVIVMEDLRTRGFKMFDRRRGMDVAHAILVLQELGRLHGASHFMEKKLPTQDVTKTWPVLVEKWIKDDFDMSEFDKFKSVASTQYEAAAMIMEKIPNYENVVNWIRKTKDSFMDVYKESFRIDTKFGVVMHGDCWNNNILFRYDDTGAPVEIMFVDLQGLRRASAAVDLNYFLYSSFNGPVRKDNLKEFLKVYYTSFSSVLEAAKIPVPFTNQELSEEFKRQMIFGCVTAMMLVPIVLSEAEDVPDILNITEDNYDEFGKQRQETILKMSERENGLLRPRLLDMFDEMVEAGVIPK